MHKIPALTILAMTLLAGCGEVVVFGHVVQEGNTKSEVKEESSSSSSTTSQTTATASSSSETSVSRTPATPVIPPVSPVQIITPSQPAKLAVSTTTSSETANHRVKAVTLSIAPDMVNKTSADSRFNSKVLLDAINAELQSRKLLDSTDSKDGTTLAIYIDNYDLHATTNFSIFGSRPHTGTLAGNLTLNDETKSITVAHIEAYSRISIPETGEDQNVLHPLYHDFAVTVANSIAGTQAKTSAELDQPPR